MLGQLENNDYVNTTYQKLYDITKGSLAEKFRYTYVHICVYVYNKIEIHVISIQFKSQQKERNKLK